MKVDIKTKPAVTEKVVLELGSKHEINQVRSILQYADHYLYINKPSLITNSDFGSIPIETYTELKQVLAQLLTQLIWK
jgi:hypothetical protein